MAELADALDLGSSAVKGVQVQVLFPAPALNPLKRMVYCVERASGSECKASTKADPSRTAGFACKAASQLKRIFSRRV